VSVANAGNLLGFSGNLSFQNRNVGKRGIKMTNALRASVELNLNAAAGTQERINSNELNFTNTISIPKIVPAWANFFKQDKTAAHQTFFNTSITNTNRIGLFKLNSLGFNMGWETNLKKNKTITIKPLNIEYSNLYDRTPAFDTTLQQNPFLRYSFNSAVVVSHQFGFVVSRASTKNVHQVSTNRINFEAAVIPFDQIEFLRKDLRRFVKLDLEKIINWKYNRHEYAFRLFAGIGMPISSSDTTLPFFKQYFAGGPNSMRGWPIRGLGPGSKKPTPFNSRQFADRTGDIRFETNFEYRSNIAQLIPNTLVLKWSMFADVGNIWNVRNTQPNGGFDSAQFKLSLHDFYKELAVAAGAGIMLDFNYVLLRFDFGFRFKRPELSKNAGWKAPSIGFDDFLKKLFTSGPNDEYKIWRYENFNFSIGLSYAF
jgi:outer membrane protein insertion porin family